MKIQEAMKSGKRYRRNNDKFAPCYGYLKDDFNKARLIFEYTVCNLSGTTSWQPMGIEDIMADDWILEEKPKEFWVARDNIGAYVVFTSPPRSAYDEVIHVREVKG